MKTKKQSSTPKKASENLGQSEAKSAQSKFGLIGKLVLPIALGATSFCTVYFLPGDTGGTGGIGNQAQLTQDADGDGHLDAPAQTEVHIPTSFVPLETFTVSLKGRTRILRLGITLEAPDTHVGAIDPNNPKLRDAFMGYLSVLDMTQVEDATFLIGLREQLTRRAKFVLGSHAVQNILITDFMVR